jgi:hypothetical protein
VSGWLSGKVTVTSLLCTAQDDSRATPRSARMFDFAGKAG